VRSALDLAFILAWTLALAVVARSLALLWKADGRLAVLSATAVGAAFFAGTLVPFASGTVTTLRPAGAASVPLLDRDPRCPPDAAVVPGGAGHIDTVAIDDGAATHPSSELQLTSKSALRVGGWAADRAFRARFACVVLDGHVLPFAHVRYGMDRPDVAQALKESALENSGFAAILPAGSVPSGAHSLTVGTANASGQIVVGAPPLQVSVQ
jgi:hypothetical protein